MIRDKVYMDNGATSYPKAPNVAKNMADYIINNGSSVSRGAYKSSLDASRIVYDTRSELCDFFNFEHVDHVVFTKNITESMNVILKGLLTEKDHVIISSMEHNAVMRPLHSIGCKLSKMASSIEGYVDVDSIETQITPETKAIVCIHSSNVCGSINNISAIGKIAKKHGVYFIVDAAQTAGVVPIDMVESHIDVLGFTGHKSLLGPTGIGGFLIAPEMVKHVKPLIEGGTGSASESEIQPEYMPDKFESGTPNVVGIYGLNAGLTFIKETGIDKIYEHEMYLVQYFLDHFKTKKNIVGKKDTIDRTAVISLNFEGYDNAIIAFELEKKYHIATRVGMHCAPSAHKTLNSFPNGTLRISFSYFTTIEEIQYLIDALEDILGRSS